MTFAQLGLSDQLVRALKQRKITEPFPVQAVTIPDALDGKDVCGKAPTGSGKTLAFGLPLLDRIERAKRNRPRALILAPTRELAEQIKIELAPLAKSVGRYVAAVYGGVSYGPQKSELRRGVDVLVATPGRLEDLIEQGVVDLGQADFVVVDEADRMADMGFLPDVRRILDMTPARRQTLLFSATLDRDIAVLSRDYQTNPVRHEAESVETDMADAQHHFWLVQHEDRIERAADVIKKAGRSIVFTRTRHGADRLARQLEQYDVDSVAMHGGRSQNQRTRALKSFATGRAQALIATDVAARGIHIDAVASVIHFDPPADHKDYLHRSGRTARAGATGTVVSLVTHQQRRAVRQLQRDLKIDIDIDRPVLDDIEAGSHDGVRHKPSRDHHETRGRSNGRSRDDRDRPRSDRPSRDRSDRNARDRSSPDRNDRDRKSRNASDRNGRDRNRDQTGRDTNGSDRPSRDRSDRNDSDRNRNDRDRNGRNERTARDRNGSDRPRRDQSDRNGRDRNGSDRKNSDRSRSDRGAPRSERPRNDRGNGRDRSAKPSTPRQEESVYIANLPWQADDRALRDMFSPHGKVFASSVIMDSRSGRSKGFGFVDMPKADAERAINALNGMKIEGRAVAVRLAKPRTYGE